MEEQGRQPIGGLLFAKTKRKKEEDENENDHKTNK